MSTTDCIIGLFYRGDLVIGHLPKHPHARLHPSEIVTLALLFALKGRSGRAFYRSLHRDDAAWFPGLPERTRVFRLFAVHRDWAEYVLADPTTLGVIDSYGRSIRGGSTGRMGRSAPKGCPIITGSLAVNSSTW